MVWAGAAASALFWGLRLGVTPLAAPPQTQVAEPGAGARGDFSRLLGAEAQAPVTAAVPEPAADARYALVGVLSPHQPQAAREGVALIAVDGKPAKAYRVGALVDGEQVLRSVGARSATLGRREGQAHIALNIAAPPAAATGTLVPATSPSTLPPVPGANPLHTPTAATVSPLAVPQPRPAVHLPATAPGVDNRELK